MADNSSRQLQGNNYSNCQVVQQRKRTQGVKLETQSPIEKPNNSIIVLDAQNPALVDFRRVPKYSIVDGFLGPRVFRAGSKTLAENNSNFEVYRFIANLWVRTWLPTFQHKTPYVGMSCLKPCAQDSNVQFIPHLPGEGC